MNPKPDTSGTELFYIDKNGKKADAELHEEMLNSITPQERHKRAGANRALARKLGLDPRINQYFAPKKG